MAALGLTGGDKLTQKLAEIAANVTQPAQLKVGFLEGARYPDGTSIAYIASIQEFGATIKRSPSTVTLFRKLNSSGTGFLRGGRFVKRRESNFSTTHAVGSYQIVIPPRPFFRNMIKAKAPSWPAEIARILKAVGYDAVLTLQQMGHEIEGQLVDSIQSLVSPPSAPSTIRKKAAGGAKRVKGVFGPEKPLIDSSKMWNSVQSEVTTGSS
jgi:hypothetical protein